MFNQEREEFEAARQQGHLSRRRTTQVPLLPRFFLTDSRSVLSAPFASTEGQWILTALHTRPNTWLFTYGPLIELLCRFHSLYCEKI